MACLCLKSFLFQRLFLRLFSFCTAAPSFWLKTSQLIPIIYEVGGLVCPVDKKMEYRLVPAVSVYPDVIMMSALGP
ncbi:unnamed protein product [Boreogadus saida]